MVDLLYPVTMSKLQQGLPKQAPPLHLRGGNTGLHRHSNSFQCLPPGVQSRFSGILFRKNRWAIAVGHEK